MDSIFLGKPKIIKSIRAIKIHNTDMQRQRHLSHLSRVQLVHQRSCIAFHHWRVLVEPRSVLSEIPERYLWRLAEVPVELQARVNIMFVLVRTFVEFHQPNPDGNDDCRKRSFSAPARIRHAANSRVAATSIFENASPQEEGTRKVAKIKFPWTSAHAMLLRKRRPKNKRLAFIFDKVHDRKARQTVSATDASEGRRACAICGAKCSRYCACGAELKASHNPERLQAFVHFQRHARNPILHFEDPRDQGEFVEAFTAVAGKLVNQGGFEELGCLLFGAAMTNKPETVKTCGHLFAAGTKASYQKAMHHKGAPVPFRGGQHPGVSKKQLPESFVEFRGSLLEAVVSHLRNMHRSKRPATRSRAFHDLVHCIWREAAAPPKQKLVSNFGKYKGKKLVEFIYLCASAGVLGLSLGPEELDQAADVWPLPDNSVMQLQTIFPDADTERLQREGLRVLQSISRAQMMSIPTLVAQLCFWCEQKNGDIDWMAD